MAPVSVSPEPSPNHQPSLRRQKRWLSDECDDYDGENQQQYQNHYALLG
jgi:hypothetical protein